jgi:hypothetical protein
LPRADASRKIALEQTALVWEKKRERKMGEKKMHSYILFPHLLFPSSIVLSENATFGEVRNRCGDGVATKLHNHARLVARISIQVLAFFHPRSHT